MCYREDVGKEGKKSFFEKKDQKTFVFYVSPAALKDNTA